MRWVGSILAVLGWLVLRAVSPAQEPKVVARDFDGWPPSWVEAYQRFEGFIVARRTTWPASHLELLADGTMTHEIRLRRSRSEHLSLDFFREGRRVLSMMMSDALFDQGRASIFVPGTYAACLKASTQSGYQYLYPLVWFEVQSPPPTAVNAARGESERTVRMLTPPAPAADHWPNERLLLFRDFNVFPSINPFDIEKMNRKVHPDLVLRLSQDGVIERTLLPERSWEQLLRWRIYRDGLLVDTSPATGVERRAIAFGPGSYEIWIGVEGPAGFLPVSNVLSFPLFPAAEKFVVIPPDANGNHVPDLLEALVAPHAQKDLSADSDGDGIPDSQESALTPQQPKESATADERRLIALWNDWMYALSYRSPVFPPAKAAK